MTGILPLPRRWSIHAFPAEKCLSFWDLLQRKSACPFGIFNEEGIPKRGRISFHRPAVGPARPDPTRPGPVLLPPSLAPADAGQKPTGGHHRNPLDFNSSSAQAASFSSSGGFGGRR